MQHVLSLPITVDETISLDLLHLQDAKALFELVEKNRAYLRTWLPWVDAVQCHQDQEEFIKTASQKWIEQQALICGIGYQQQVVGAIELRDFDWEHGTSAIGYWLDEAHQGQGIMTRACQAMIQVAFQQLGLRSLTICCATENYKSQGVPSRLGFTWDKTFSKREWLYDHYVDLHAYRLTQHEKTKATP